MNEGESLLDDKIEEIEWIEEQVLGAAIQNPYMIEKIMRGGVNESDFETVRHGHIWSAILSAYSEHGRADAPVINRFLEKRKGWNFTEARVAIRQCMDTSFGISEETISGYVNRIKIHAGIRRIHIVGSELLSSKHSNSPSEIGSKAIREIEQIIAGTTSHTNTKTSDELLREFSGKIHNAHSKKKLKLPIGIESIEANIGGGGEGGRVAIFAADTGVGKSTFMRHMIISALRAGTKVGAISFETKSDQIFNDLIEMIAGIRLSEVSTSEEMTRIIQASEWLGSQSLVIDDSESMTVEEVCSKMHMWKHDFGTQQVFIDYVQDIERSTKFQRDDLNWAHISKALRRSAVRNDQFVIELAQLKEREKTFGKQKVDHGPTEEDIAFSRQFAKDASFVCIADRPKLNDEESTRNTTRIRLVKNRINGKLTRSFMRYDPKTTRVTECDSNGRIGEQKKTVSTPVEIPDEVIDDEIDIASIW